MISNQEKLEVLETILSSEEFGHSPKYKDLLKYLVDASIQDKELNEITIAEEFFCKNSNFDPLQDATIRVYVSQIRKKLATYYLSAGKADKIRIDIPKGHYSVRFCTKSAIQPGTIKNKIKKYIFPVITFFLLLLVIVFVIKYERLYKKVNIIPKNNPLWTEYLTDTRPTLVILGDYFFMYNDRGDKPRLSVRDPLINSLEEFQQLSKKNSVELENLKPLAHTFLRPSAVWGIIEILPILQTVKSSFLVKQASEIVWEDMSTHNVIFIGTFKQMYIFKTLLGKINTGFSLYPNILYLYDKNGKVVQTFESTLDPDTRQYDDIGLLAKMNGPNNNTIMLVTGFHEGSVINISKTIANPDFLQNLLKEYGEVAKKPLFFRSVLKVAGFNTTDWDSKIEYFEVLSL